MCSQPLGATDTLATPWAELVNQLEAANIKYVHTCETLETRAKVERKPRGQGRSRCRGASPPSRRTIWKAGILTRHHEAPRAIAEPEAGWFKIRMVKNGPHVAARIHRSLGAFWSASINGVSCGAEDTNPAKSDGVYRIWATGTRITKSEYDALLKSPPSSPRLAIDIGAEKPGF